MGEAIREKINERMKLLQAIVPGCDKVTGKALDHMSSPYKIKFIDSGVDGVLLLGVATLVAAVVALSR
ncbi:putative transcription factor bHLH family [Helianthus debilis subsp. tardiflorus]